MGVGPIGGQTVAFSIKAVADLRGIESTSKALAALARQGSTAGTGIAAGVGKAAGSFDRIEREAREAAVAIDRLGDEGREAGRAVDRGMDQAGDAMAETGRRAQSLESDLANIERAGLVVGASVFAALGLAVKSFANFDTEMRAAAAVTGATAAEMEQLRAKALQMGKDTSFSASEAAGAITELGRAGVATADILGGAAQGAADLAAAAGIGIPEAAGIIATAMNVFGLAGADATRIADVFANAEVRTAATTTDLALALSQAGQLATQFGIPLEDTVGTLALFADQGLRGSDAGTSFRTMLLAMLDPTKEQTQRMRELGISFHDSEGNFIGLAGVAEQLKSRLSGLSQQQRNTALAVLFGNDAVRAANILYGQGAEGVGEYADAMRKTGTAAEVAETRLGGIMGTLEKLAGSVETLAIEFGENLAPAVEAVADAISGTAEVFASLPESVQTTVVAVAALTGGLALVAAGSARAITAARNIKQAFDAVTLSADGTTRSFKGLATGVGVAVGLSAITFAIGKTAQEMAAAKKGFDDLGTAISDLNEIIENSEIAGDVFGTLNTRQIQADFAAVSTAVAKARGEIEKTQDVNVGFGHIPSPGELLPFWSSDMEDLGAASQETADQLKRVEQLLGDPNIDTGKLAAGVEAAAATFAASKGGKEDLDAFNASVKALVDNKSELAKTTREVADANQDGTVSTEEHTAALADQVATTIEAQKTQEELKRAVQATQTAQFLAAQAARGLFLPFTRGADDAEKATIDFNRSLDELIAASHATSLGIEDIAPSLAGMQAGFGDAGMSVTDLVRRMDDVGVLDLSDASREALDMASALIKVEAKIERVEAAIANNAEDLAMWRGRIALVTDTFGAQSDFIDDWIGQLERGEITQARFNDRVQRLLTGGGMPKLDALLRRGKITHQEYNDAVAAGIHLIQRSAGALSDEEAEQVRNIIALDRLVIAHDNAHGAVKALTDEQRALAAAMGDATVQHQLQMLQLLAQLALVGQIPAEVVTNYILDTADADPKFAVVAEQLGILDDGKVVPLDADTEAYDAATRGIEEEQLPPKTVTITPVVADIMAAINPFGGAPAGVAVAQPAPVVFTAVDEVTPTAADISAAIAGLESSAGASAANIATAIESGIGGGFANAQVVATNGATAIVGAVNGLWNPLFNSGFDGGYWYGIGVARGIMSQWNAVFNAGYLVGQAADLGTKRGMQAQSPSRLAIAAGQNWTASFADSIRAGTGDVRSAGEELSRALAGTIAEPTTSAAMRGVLTVDHRPTDVLAAGVIPASVAMHRTVQAGGVTINVNGSGDPDAVADRVYRALDGAFGRLELEVRR